MKIPTELKDGLRVLSASEYEIWANVFMEGVMGKTPPVIQANPEVDGDPYLALAHDAANRADAVISILRMREPTIDPATMLESQLESQEGAIGEALGEAIGKALGQ